MQTAKTVFESIGLQNITTAQLGKFESVAGSNDVVMQLIKYFE